MTDARACVLELDGIKLQIETREPSLLETGDIKYTPTGNAWKLLTIAVKKQGKEIAIAHPTKVERVYAIYVMRKAYRHGKRKVRQAEAEELKKI